jgi:hypothetical protein
LTDYLSIDAAGTALLALLEDPGDRETGRDGMRRYSWSQKIHEWLAVYRHVVSAESHATELS